MEGQDVPCARCLVLEARIAELEKIVAEQQKLIAELLERLNKNSSNSSKPPSSNPPWIKPLPPKPKSGKKRGGQPGRRRVERELAPPEKVSQTIDVRPERCSDCGAKLEGDDPEPRRHQTVEIPPVEPTIVEHRMHALTCRRCRSVTKAALPEGVGPGAFGPRLSAFVAIGSGAYRLSKRSLKRLLADCFGLSISTGAICKQQRRTAEVLESPVAEVAEHVRTEHVNIDETSWLEGRLRCWLWTACTSSATLFRIAASRSAEVAKSLLGSAFPHVAMCDRYAGYLWIGRVQLCWAHLRRDFQAMIDRGRDGKPVGEALLSHAEVLFDWWHRVRDGTLARSTLRTYVGNLRAAFRDDLERGAECGGAKTAGTCRQLLADEPHLWTFVSRPGVEPTNNAAERALRHAVLWRKSSFGTDGAIGSRFVERILTVVATCRQRGRNILDYLANCHAAAQHALPIPSLLN
jgi:transposase